MIKKFITIIILLFSTLTFIVDVNPVNATTNPAAVLSSNIIIQNFATLDYEAKENTTLQQPITDPNFNVMRNQELGKSKAIPLVVGILLIAIIAPIATWYYFNN